MRILVDENIPLMSVLTLRRLGHEVIDIRGTKDEGISDERLWEVVQENEALLITTDKGFRHHHPSRNHFGILIVRLRRPNRERIHKRILDMMARFSPNEWRGMLVIAQDKIHRVSYSSKRS